MWNGESRWGCHCYVAVRGEEEGAGRVEWSDESVVRLALCLCE